MTGRETWLLLAACGWFLIFVAVCGGPCGCGYERRGYVDSPEYPCSADAGDGGAGDGDGRTGRMFDPNQTTGSRCLP